jgi:cyclase
MLGDMRRAVPQADRIDTLVNTHANGDHTYGNQLVAGARIVASERTATEMAELPPEAMAGLIEQAPKMGRVGEFFLECFGSFEFAGIELTSPSDTFHDELTLRVGELEAHLIEVGPAHTRGDTLVHLPARRVLFAGDILFHGGHPIAWAGPVSNWIAACERILTLDVDVIVPGHGPLADKAAVRDLRAYFEYVHDQARERFQAGMTPLEAARDMAMDRYAQWGDSERLVVNVHTIFRELSGETGGPDALTAFAEMAEMAHAKRET